MEDTTISTKKFIFKYGIILGAIWVVYLFLWYTITGGVSLPSKNRLLSIIELVLHCSIIYPIYRYKLINNGFLNLKQAIKIGISIALIAYFINLTYFTITMKIAEQGEVIQSLNDAREKMLVNHPDMSPEAIRKTIKSPEKYSPQLLYGN
ncbi:DUF4199 domain-containing protein [Aquimarina mytili]|uniref:DUF4199 domain-containing protein n=1 Tax=Aquimarina mytili TaxID=874423 RepID=A0A937A165_9FLAO|nr:DUF4199 domain-containing protein [Aquimarina mytili]MBL0685703.1 DUF4199 domain-containing protein [Aquimarina mytili]